MKEFFSSIEQILFCPTIAEKISNFKDFYSDFLESKILYNPNQDLRIQAQPSYFNLCQITHPTKISRPKKLTTNRNIAKIIHSIAHIEYSAIDLALDTAYRFRNLPTQYYQDWIEVANEEIQHFQLLEAILQELGFCYGDFDVHDNLYQAMMITHSSLADRIGLVHRGLEAMGLDANPFVIQKIQTTTHPIKSKIIQTLHIILKDEISHVSKGSKWWKTIQPNQDAFAQLIKKFNYFNFSGKILNTQARLQAGFSLEEIKELEVNHIKP
ncbi:ferritin-like domain-containing protein [Helicobacter sp. 13S00477-4]|uniref:ferritin-like domain-containing protein n=1 Tax=Helicobacter sp. 13S00477-4 TaxID=1905759 RepID=UPI000BA77ED6|nr:ferritin-like domain-containing protein [Helicobacter sp. 13S00477-4]PAF50500.1 hypothetical protein BKH44_08065 [Helicobacter sp. 13S00477-4]